MKLLEHLNLYYGCEANNIQEFIKDFKDDFEDDDKNAVTSLLMFLNSASKFI